MLKGTTIKNIIYHFLIVLFVLIILVVLFLLFLFFKDKYFDKGNHNKQLFGFYIIVSGSMEPTIHVNDAVFLVRLDHDKYKVGDIITFLPEEETYKGMTVTHRIVKKDKIGDEMSLYTTKGDNNINNDRGKVSTNGIYGKVLLIIPGVGNLKKFFAKPIHFLYLFLLLMLLLLIINWKKIFRKKS